MIKRWLTAIKRLGPSKPARAAMEAGLVVGRVLDYGCGRGADVAYFRKEVGHCDGYDPGHEHWRMPVSGQYDFVLCTFVLNVIEDPGERVEVLRAVKGHMKPDGRALVAVRGPDDVKVGPEWEEHGDGWRTPRNTFQRTFTREQLKRVAKRAGLRVLRSCDFDVSLPGRITWIVVAR